MTQQKDLGHERVTTCDSVKEWAKIYRNYLKAGLACLPDSIITVINMRGGVS